MRPSGRYRPAIWGLIYLVFVVVLIGGFWQARQRVLRQYSSPNAQIEWKRWRDAAARQAEGEGPVLRRVPKSDEPPSLVLLRDHFATSLLGMLLLTTAILFALATMIRGAISGPRFEVDLEDDSAERSEV